MILDTGYLMQVQCITMCDVRSVIWDKKIILNLTSHIAHRKTRHPVPRTLNPYID